jgi:hypothetical protein
MQDKASLVEMYEPVSAIEELYRRKQENGTLIAVFPPIIPEFSKNDVQK